MPAYEQSTRDSNNSQCRHIVWPRGIFIPILLEAPSAITKFAIRIAKRILKCSTCASNYARLLILGKMITQSALQKIKLIAIKNLHLRQCLLAPSVLLVFQLRTGGARNSLANTRRNYSVLLQASMKETINILGLYLICLNLQQLRVCCSLIIRKNEHNSSQERRILRNKLSPHIKYLGNRTSSSGCFTRNLRTAGTSLLPCRIQSRPEQYLILQGLHQQPCCMH